MKKNKDSICAIVVIYSRKKLLLECLESLKNQTRSLQGIYIINNASTDGTPELLLEKGYIKELPPKNLSKPWEKEFEIKNAVNKESIKIHYVKMNENTGGAGGFHEGVKREYEKGYDWLWLMDDDVEYSLRVREYGKILFKLDSIIKHKYNMDIPLTVKEIYKFRFFIWNIKIYWKFLCGLRNKKYIYKKYSNRFYLILFLIKQIFQLIISNYKKLRLKYFFKFLKQENLSDFGTIKPNEWQEILKKYRI